MEEFAIRRRLLELEAKVSGLQADAARYRALLRARNDLIVELDERGLVSAVSPALLERSGYSASECLGRSTFAFTTPECAQRLRVQSPTLFDWAARRHPFEILMLCKNGGEIWLEGNIYAYSTEGGVSGMFCLYRDITENKVFEGENRRMGEGAINALALAGVEAFEFDFLEGLVWQSPGYGELFGLGANDARYVGIYGWLGKVSTPDQALAADRVELAKKMSGDAPPVIVRIQQADGEIRYLKVHDHYEFDADESLTRILVSARDVTGEQKDKIELQNSRDFATRQTGSNTQQQLEQAMQRLELAFQIGEIGVAEWSRDKGWFGVSDRYRATLGLPATGHPEKFEQFVKRVHHQDRDSVLQIAQSSFDTGVAKLQRYRYQHPDGRLAHLESGARYIKNAQGELESVISIVRDQTEVRAVEQSLRSSLERLSVAMQIGNVHFFEHDIKNDAYQISDGFYQLFGLNPDQRISTTILLDCIDPQDHARLPNHRSGLQGTAIGPVRFRVRSDAGVRWIESMTAFYFDDTGVVERSAGAMREITDQVLIEEEIKAQTNLFSALVEYSPDGVVRIDAEARFVSANPAVATLIGFPVEEIIGRTPAELPISPERAYEFRTRIDRFFATGLGDEFELQFKKLPNAPWLLVRYVPELGADGKPKYLLAFLRDVSQLKSAEQEALANARQLGQILETAEEGILVADANNIIIFNNPKLEQIFGYAPNELRGKPESLLQLSDAEKQMQQRSQERASGLSESYSHHFRRKDGSLVLCWVNAKPLQDELGNFSGTLAMLTDVSDIERSERELRKGIEWLEFSMESAQIAGMDVDVESGFLRTTVLFREWFGIPEDGDSSPLLNWTSRIYHEDRARIQTQIQSILDRCASARLDFRLVDSAGEMRWLYAVIVTVANVKGALARVVFTLLDITPRRKLEAEREALQSQVARAQREESLGNLAAGFAHDLNNLLTTAFGHIDLARLMIQESDADHSLQHVAESLTQIAKLSEQLFAYSGKTPLNSKSLDLNESLRKILSIMTVSVSKKAHFTTHLSPEQLVLHAEESQLQQVALNLVLNASEALEGRGGDIEIATEKVSRASLAPSTQLCIDADIVHLAKLSVRDTGDGIPDNVQARLFEPFFSTKGQGRGLGMSVVAGIVRAHRGAIEVLSSPELGTTLSVYLPLESVARVTAIGLFNGNEIAAPGVVLPTPLESAVAQTPTKLPLHSGLILVVDDEPTLRNLICRTLNTQGFETISAANGDEALVLMAARPEIILVLLDLTMPQRDGLEVYAEVLAFYPKLAVMLMSGYNEQSVASRLGPDAPVPAFLHKPFRSTELLSMVRKTLAGT